RERREVIEQPYHVGETQRALHHGGAGHHGHADGDLHGARATEQREHAIDQDRDEQDVERVTPAERDEKVAHDRACRRRWATRTASRVSATSCVRISAAPWTTAMAVAASEPARRSAVSARSSTAP